HAAGAQRADQGQAVELRQHAVDDEHIVLAVKRQREAFLAVEGLIGNVADFAKRLGEIIRSVVIILDDEQTHERSSMIKEYHDLGFANTMAERQAACRAVAWIKTCANTCREMLEESEGAAGSGPPPPPYSGSGGGDGCRERAI